MRTILEEMVYKYCQEQQAKGKSATVEGCAQFFNLSEAMVRDYVNRHAEPEILKTLRGIFDGKK